jgi:hypothetical protein
MMLFPLFYHSSPSAYCSPLQKRSPLRGSFCIPLMDHDSHGLTHPQKKSLTEVYWIEATEDAVGWYAIYFLFYIGEEDRKAHVMSSETLRSTLQKLLQQGQLTLSSTTFDSASVKMLIDTYYAGAPIVLRQAQIAPDSPAATTIAITGVSTFLNVEDVPVTANFEEAPDGVAITLRYHLPATWAFSQSFPHLPVSFDFRQPFGAAQRSYLDLLTLTDARFIVSTKDHIDQEFNVPLCQGLNFICHMHLNGLLGSIEQMIGTTEPLILSGPILLPPLNPTLPLPVLPRVLPRRTSTPLIGINLQALTHAQLARGSVKLDSTYINLYSPLTADWLASHPSYTPGMFFGGDIHVGGHVTMDAVAEVPPGLADTLTFSGIFEGLTLPSLSDLADLVGADDLASQLAPHLPLPGSLNLQAVALSVSFDPLSLDIVSLLISLDNQPWRPIDDTIDGHRLLVEVSQVFVRFTVIDPLGRGRSLSTMLLGSLSVADVPMTIMASVPDFVITGDLSPQTALPLASLLRAYLPDVPPVGDLLIDQVFFTAVPGQSLSIQAAMADQPHPWVIDLGSKPLTISDVQLRIDYARGSGINGAFSGTLALAGVSLALAYQVPGAFSLRGQLPPLHLRALVESLCGDVIPGPREFDIAFTNAQVRIEKDAIAHTLLLAAQVDDFGSVALQVKQANSVWGFAVGMDLPQQWKLSRLSSALAPFDSSFRFQKMVLVIASLQDPGFTFPDLAAFNMPTITSPRINLPSSAVGVVPGINFYAEMEFGGQKGLELLKKTLNMSDVTLPIRLQIGENPALNSLLTASIAGQFNSAVTLSGTLRLQLSAGVVILSVLASATATVHNQPLTFSSELDVTEGGLYFAATMQGSWRQAFTIPSLTLSDLALLVGCNWEGIPTLGLAGTLDLDGFRGAIAILFDSVAPQRSLLAGSISDLTLANVYSTLVSTVVSPPTALDRVLEEVSLKGTALFTIPGSLAADLDKNIVSPGLIQAFAQGRVSLPTRASDVLLVTGKAGSLWYLTDRTTLKHYTITLVGDHLQVALAVQLYLAPEATMIGQLAYPQGIRLNAALDCFGLNGTASVDVSTNQGIAVDGTINSITIGEIFALTGHGGRGDPLISLATYDAPTSRYRGIHCIFSGAVTMLGFTRDIDLLVTKDGFAFSVSARLFNVFQASLTAQCPLSNFASADFTITATMDNDFYQYLKTQGTAAIAQEARSAISSLSDAQQKVDNAQQMVASLQEQIKAGRAVVQGERDRALQKLNAARAKVASIQNSIDANQYTIDQLNKEIQALKGDASKHWLHAAGDGARITERETEVGAHETAMSGEKGALAAAQGELNLDGKAIQATPVEADPRVAPLYTKLGTATAGLETAKGTLEGLKKAVGAMASVGGWISKQGQDSLLSITHASFTGQLSHLNSGSVSMAIDLVFMNTSYHEVVDFNFYHPDQTIGNLVAALKKHL